MKHLFSLIFIAGTVIGFSQDSNKQLNEWDSLRIKTAEKLQLYEDFVFQQLSYTDTHHIKNQVIITYYATNRRKLKEVSNYLDSNNCILGIQYKYYNASELLVFRSGYRKCCKQEQDDDYKCFEKVTDYARFEYDSKGRITLSIIHVTTPMTYREKFTYAQDGTQKLKREKITEPKFWDSN